MKLLLIPFLFLLSFTYSQSITEKEFEDKISEDIVVIEFYAEWNKQNCIDLNEFKDVSAYMVNIEECPNLAQTYKIISIPTVIVFYNKEAVAKYEADLTFQLSIKEAKKKVEELVLKKFM